MDQSDDPHSTIQPDNNGWIEYKRFVVTSLESTHRRLNNIDTRLRTIERDIAIIKTKMYVAAAGVAIVFSSAIAVLFRVLEP
jgi:hypothetical protein